MSRVEALGSGLQKYEVKCSKLRHGMSLEIYKITSYAGDRYERLLIGIDLSPKEAERLSKLLAGGPQEGDSGD